MNTNNNLPLQTTSFVGRKREIAEIRELFTNDDCRLVTLIGPGGIGKTRIGISVGHALHSHFNDGVYFVHLQPLTSHKNILSTVAQELGVHFQENSLEQHLVDYLEDKHLLLILDNFEHIIEGVDVISNLLSTTINTNFLITSREPLKLRGEWTYQIRGMLYPKDKNDIVVNDAVTLFIERARQVRSDFELEEDTTAVADICRLVGGTPLAIELATTWLFSLSSAEIAEQIQRNLDFLATQMRDIPPRHQSIRAVFLHSWQLLTDEEKAVYAKLSVFRGGFTREAAQVITNASLHTIHALIQKSLIRSLPNNRYDVHEILRQYAAEQLNENRKVSESTNEIHTWYYISLLGKHESALNSSQQLKSITTLESDIDNIRAAWLRAVDTSNAEIIREGCHAYYIYCDMQGRYLECANMISQAIERLISSDQSEAISLAIAIAQNALVGLFIRLGEFEQAKLAGETSIGLFVALKQKPPPGFGTEPLTHMALLNVTAGNYDIALHYGEKALERIEATDKLNLMFAHYVMSTTAYSKGLYERATDHAQHAYQMSSSLGDEYFTSYILIVMGNISEMIANYEQAQSHYLMSYEIKEKLDEKPGMAFALNHIAQIALIRRDYTEAQKLFKKVLELHDEIRDPGGKATAIFGLGDTAIALGNNADALLSFREAMDIAVEITWTPLILKIITGISILTLRSKSQNSSIRLLSYVAENSSSEQQTRQRAKSVLAENVIDDTSLVKPLNSMSAAVSLAYEILQQLMDELSQENERQNGEEANDFLTEQEINILKLVANGMTNRQIANELNFTVGTIKWYLHQIYTKLHVSNRTEAVATARRLDLLS